MIMEDILKNRNWEEFTINDIFIVSTGAQISKTSLGKGKIPRISATENNNGITDFHSPIKNKNYREFSNFISVSFLGGVFYHSYKASLDMKIHSIQLKNRELNKYVAEFLVIALKRMAAIYSYGDQLSSTDILNKKVFLPVTSENQPDYAFMEEYMRNLERKKIAEYQSFIAKTGGGVNC
jgi:hypothetical protein